MKLRNKIEKITIMTYNKNYVISFSKNIRYNN